MSELSRAAQMLRAADDIMIITHRRPDGDTVGAGFALCRALSQLGKRCFVSNCDEIYPKLLCVTGGKSTLGVEFEPRFIVAVDIAEPSLMGSLEEYADRVDLCIDHHKSNRRFAKYTLLDSAAGSACEIIFDLLGELGVKPDKEIATALYVGLSTDTGCFRFRNNSPKTMRAAAALMETGVDFGELNKTFFESVSLNRVLLLREIFNNMEIFCDGKLAVSHIGLYDYDEDDYNGLAGELRKIDGVAASVLLRRTADDEYKLSARSNIGFDCSEMCSAFGGGGHEGAAGATLYGALSDCIEKVKAAMTAELRRNA